MHANRQSAPGPTGGLLLLGDTGLAGVAILEAARRRGLPVLGASRRGEAPVDLRDAAALQALLTAVRPQVIVNAAAMVAVAQCEADPGEAWRINARPAALIAAYAQSAGARVLHVSTDHFYSGDGRRRHRESDPVVLLNDYARTKYAAETFALTHPDTLVLRTNILGLRSATGGSFGEWAMGVIAQDAAATLFEDQFVSTVDVWWFAEAVLDLAATSERGLLNLAAGEVFSKAELVEAMAAALGRALTRARRGSVTTQGVPRPDSLGLDVGRLEQILGRPAPALAEVAAAVAARAQQTRSQGHALGV